MNPTTPSATPDLVLEGRVLRMYLPAVTTEDVERMSDAQRSDVDLIIINMTNTVSLGDRYLCGLLVDGRVRRFDRARGIHIYGVAIHRSDLIAALMFYTGVRFLSVNTPNMPHLVADLQLDKRPALAELWVPLNSGGACQRAAVAKCSGPIAPVVRYFVGEGSWSNAPPEADAADPVVAAFGRLCPTPLKPAPRPAPKDGTTLSHTDGTVTLSDCRFAVSSRRSRFPDEPTAIVYARGSRDTWTNVGITGPLAVGATDQIDTILKAAVWPGQIRLVFTRVAQNLEVMHFLLVQLSTTWLAKRGDPELVFVVPDEAPGISIEALSLLAQRGRDAHISLEMDSRLVSLADACAWTLAPLLGVAQPPAPGGVDYEEIFAASTRWLSQDALALYEWVRYSTPSVAAVEDPRPALPRADRLQRREPEPTESGSSGEFSESEASDSDCDPPGPECMDFSDDAGADTPPASPEPLSNRPPTAVRKRSFLASLFW